MDIRFHSTVYRLYKSASRRLRTDVSIGFRIYFSAALILLTSCATFAAVFYFQQQQALITHTILDERITAMMTAQHVKELLVRHDNEVFRYVATKSSKNLLNARSIQTEVLRDLSQLQVLTVNPTIRSKITALHARMNNYYEQSNDVVDFARSNVLPSTATLFQAASWARSQGSQKRELQVLSAQGDLRMQQAFSLCDDILTYEQARLADARVEIDRLIQKSVSWGKITIVVASIIVFLISLGLAMSLLGPIGDLLAGVQRVQQGDLDTELPVLSSTEIGQLSNAFNRMTRTIREQRERLLHETITDDLTGAYNKRYFSRRLDQELDRARRSGSPLSLLMIDLDHFKGFNDERGHEMGNVLLRHLSGIVRENLRQHDLLFRYGGDEFAALLPDAGSHKAGEIARRLVEIISTSHLPGDQDRSDNRQVTLSVGGATFPEQAHSSADLIQKADEALYRVKSAGRNAAQWAEIPISRLS